MTDEQLLDFVNELKCTEQGDRMHCIVGSGPSVWNEMAGEIDFMEGKEQATVDRVNIEGGLSEESGITAETHGLHVEDMKSATCFVEHRRVSGNDILECYPRA